MKKLKITLIILAVFTATIVLLSHLSIVDSVSMEPTLMPGDIVLCSKNIDSHDIRLHDVIIFRSLEDDSTLLVKRVYNIKYNHADNIEYDVRGDNKNNSCDSRSFGLVPMEKIDGKACIILASWDCEQKKIRPDRFLKRIK